jgi:ubiquinone biosynthesis protein COQ9
MWYAAGDRSADFSWYTRRATLAAVYTATLAFWLGPRAPDMEEALAFLDRRLADLAPRKRAA